MKRRRLVAIAIFTTPLLALGACGFPDLTFGPGTSDEAGMPESGGDTSSTVDTGSRDSTIDTGSDTSVDPETDAADADADASDAESDATDSFDASDGADASDAADAADTGPVNPCAPNPKCDCDDDGYGDVNCDVNPTTITGSNGLPLKAGDCDDTDSRRHPGQGFVSDVPPPGKDGNWDCSLPIELLHPPISCTGTGLLGCAGTPSFLGVVGCGVQADLYSCQGAPGNPLATCVGTVAGGQITQGCK